MLAIILPLVLLLSFFISYSLRSFFQGHVYFARYWQNTYYHNVYNPTLWGKKTDSRHFSGARARVFSFLMLLAEVFWALFLLPSIWQFNKPELMYTIAIAVLGIISGTVFYTTNRRRWKKQEDKNPIRIRRDY